MRKLHFVVEKESKEVLTGSIDLITHFNLYDKFQRTVSHNSYKEFLKNVIGLVDYSPDNSLYKLLEQEDFSNQVVKLTKDQLQSFDLKSTQELEFKFLKETEKEPKKEKFIIKLDMKSMKRKKVPE
jgi:hypothetical protein